MSASDTPSRTTSLKRFFSRGGKADRRKQSAEGSSPKQKVKSASQPKAPQEGAQDSPSSAQANSTEQPAASKNPVKDSNNTNNTHHPSDPQATSPQSGEKGQVPSPSHSVPQPATSTSASSSSLPPDTEVMTPSSPIDGSDESTEKQKRRESSGTYTLTVPLRGHHHARKETRSTSESTTVTPQRPSTISGPQTSSKSADKKRKMGFFGRITTLLTSSSPQALTIVPPPTLQDGEIVVPPTPTRQLLPLSETDGLTSGAVQPPGSTGEETKQEIVQVVVGDSGEESDGSYSEDEVFTVGLRVEDLEDEEQRLIKQGGTGIPTGPDGKPKPLLPPVSPKHAGRKCLVLDLDETLVHSSLKPVPSPDFIVPVEIEYNWHNFYVLKRPGVDSFLRRMGELYEVVVFTASLSKYADPVLDRLDPERTVAHRLFRESCYNHRGNYVKDLSQLGRPIGDTIILDNSPASYIFHPHNAVPVSSWFSDIHDTELSDMTPFLADLSVTSDVREILNPSM
ncbi:hypothetical protein NLI96_g9281 [Meripilus lineatus]|uniref:FCP1 homology domain-containing protein n=1 Tax=Meripilus lineatus TaxID=2056292 RepID=A0AAD5UXH2_9APHY|nr:hypothetical protein NLI96_g9281 [Physisporinus lineatus]